MIRHSSLNPVKLRRAALMIGLCFLLSLLLSVAFIALHAEHEHDHLGEGGHCATCAQLAASGHLLKQLALLAACASGAALWLRRAHTPQRPPLRRVCATTPVSLNIRMNN